MRAALETCAVLMRRNEKFYAEKAERDAQRKAVMRETAGEPYHKEVSPSLSGLKCGRVYLQDFYC